MQYLLSVLPVLACPLGMGAMMWLMMRGMKEPTTTNVTENSPRQARERSPASEERTVQPGPSPSLFKSIWDCVQMCLNWKVLVGLLVVAVVFAAFSPGLFVAAIPVLVILVCPLSMGIMLLRMGKMRQSPARSTPGCCQPDQKDQSNPEQLYDSFDFSAGERYPVPSHPEIISHE